MQPRFSRLSSPLRLDLSTDHILDWFRIVRLATKLPVSSHGSRLGARLGLARNFLRQYFSRQARTSYSSARTDTSSGLINFFFTARFGQSSAASADVAVLPRMLPDEASGK